MKAIAVETKSDLAAVAPYAKVADRLLFDARAPREATRPGGLGRPFDWRLLESLDPGVPFMLSGGLDAGNVAEALRITRAAASMSPRESSVRRARRMLIKSAPSCARRGRLRPTSSGHPHERAATQFVPHRAR